MAAPDDGPVLGVRALGLAVGLGLLVLTLTLVDRDALLVRFARLQPGYVAIGALIAVPQLALCALRWRFTARRLDVMIGYRDALREFALSTFVNQLLPFGMLGDALRVVRHAGRLHERAGMVDVDGDDLSRDADRHPFASTAQLALPSTTTTSAYGRPSLRPALHAVLVERSSGQLVVLAWALASAPGWFGAHSHISVWALGLAALVLGYALHRWARAGVRTVDTLPRWQRFAFDFDRAFLAPRALLVQVALSSAILVTITAQLCCALWSLGLSLPLSAALRIFPLMLLSMALPFSFAGFGPREAATASLYHAARLSVSDGAAFAMAYGAMTLLAALPGFCIVVLARRSDR